MLNTRHSLALTANLYSHYITKPPGKTTHGQEIFPTTHQLLLFLLFSKQP